MANNWLDEAMTLDDSENIYNRNLAKRGKEKYDVSHMKSSSQRVHNVKEIDDGYDEDDEDDDDNIVGRTRGRVKIPRVQTSDGPEACTCFPKRSSKNIPSMLYEGLQCKHTGLKGETHAGVAKFPSNWKREHEEVDPDGTMPQKTSFILGYPKPINLDPDTENSDEENIANLTVKQPAKVKSEFKNSFKRKTISQKSRNDNVSRKSKKEKDKPSNDKKPFAGLLDYMEEDENEEERPVSRPLIEGLTLPQIGITPPPIPPRERLNSRERLSARSIAHSLPPLPESPYLSGQKDIDKSHNQNTIYEDGIRNFNDDELQNKRYRQNGGGSERKFIGHYYDTASRQTRNYEITPQFRKGLKEWNAYMNDTNKQNYMISGLQGRRTTNGNLYSRQNITVPEDDEYDDNVSDYEDDKKPKAKETMKGLWQNKLKK